MSRLQRQTWEWAFDGPATVIWPLYADTSRFNEAAGYQPYEIDEVPQPDGSVRYFVETKLGPYALAWEEIPANWQEGHWFSHDRRFTRGPFRQMNVRVRVEERGARCVFHYTLEVEPANLVGALVMKGGFFGKVGRTFDRLAAGFARYADGQSAQPYVPGPPRLAAGARARCAQIGMELARSPYAHKLQDRLIAWILERSENDVMPLRPKTLAREWRLPERHVTELCLVAASKGLLSLRWALLCPNCRIGKAESARMDEIPRGAHCSSCNIDYQRDFNRNVELAFLPSKAIRPLHSGEYCLFGPMSTPHIKAQLRVDPGTARQETNYLAPGNYRIRTLEPGNDVYLDWSGGNFPRIVFDPQGQLNLEYELAAATLYIDNHFRHHRTVIIELRAWMQDVLTAREAATLQCFRDLFSEQVLRAGDHVEIDNVVLMFTDIKASTALYNQIGDAAAYALVREHFAVLATCVRRCNGTIVKTIGDAIMAAFDQPLDGVVCALAIQQAFALFNSERTGSDAQVTVKIGMHMGPCISVTLNGILDYYGKVANLTARLAGLSEGDDVVLSQALADDP
ncbi:MAG TPA: adenylate/guanylate cyclase domain-containing protein, partial [Pseudomonadales bacterium]